MSDDKVPGEDPIPEPPDRIPPSPPVYETIKKSQDQDSVQKR